MNGTLLRRSWLGFWSLCSQKSASGMSWTCFPAPNYATKNPWLWTETKQQIWGSWKMGSIFKQVTGVWSLDIIDFNRLCFCLPCQVAVKVAAEKDVRFWAQFEEFRSVTTRSHDIELMWEKITVTLPSCFTGKLTCWVSLVLQRNITWVADSRNWVKQIDVELQIRWFFIETKIRYTFSLVVCL